MLLSQLLQRGLSQFRQMMYENVGSSICHPKWSTQTNFMNMLTSKFFNKLARVYPAFAKKG